MEQPQIISKYMGIIPACCSCRSSTGWHCGSTAGRKGEGSGLRGGWEVWWFAPQEENSPLQWSVNYLELSLKLFKIVNFKISFKNSHQTEVFHILKGFVSTKTKCKFQRIPVLQTPLRILHWSPESLPLLIPGIIAARSSAMGKPSWQ